MTAAMGFRREVEGAEPSPPPPPTDTGKSPLHDIIRGAISAILASECMGLQLLRKLHALLGNFVFRASVTILNQQDVRNLSDILFKNLEDRFRQYFLSLKEICKCFASEENTAQLPLDFRCRIEELILLLRCCLTILSWPGFDQKVILEKSVSLLSILRRLISFDVRRSDGKQLIIFKKLRRERSYEKDGVTTSVVEDLFASLRFYEPTDPCRSSLCSLLEVFADQLMTALSLRKFFACVESAAPHKPLFKSNVCSSQIEIVLEVICAHLLLTTSDDQAVENALDRLNRQNIKELRFPELSLSSALELLLNPILSSAPQLFQAHLILLVSEAIDAETPHQLIGQRVREIDCYIIAFEKSLDLLKKHICYYLDDISPRAKDSFYHSYPPGQILPSFRSCIKEVTGKILDLLDVKLELLWSRHMQNKPLQSREDLLSTSITFITENTCTLEEPCRNEISSVLVSLTLRAFLDAPCDELHMIRLGNLKDIYLLSSILRLMNSSMMQILSVLRHGGNKGHFNGLKDFSSCRGYKLLLAAMRGFEHFDVHLSVQNSLSEMLKAHPLNRHVESSLMLTHFSRLLSLGFTCGVDVLVKACLSMIIAVLNLVIFEEGNLSALRSLLGADAELSPSGNCCREEEISETQRHREKRKRSSKIASTFLKFQRQCLLNQQESGDCVDTVGLHKRREETCSGEVYFKSLLKGSEADFNDLVDFVEFTEGKDYSLWSKNREKYRKWRLEKTAIFRWKQKKTTLRMMDRGKKM